MYLENIKGPQDIKGFTPEERCTLAVEMREAMLKRASIHGGHFGPDFGIVDKIIACFIQLNKYKKTSKPYHIWASRSFCTVGRGQKQVIGSWERLGIMV